MTQMSNSNRNKKNTLPKKVVYNVVYNLSPGCDAMYWQLVDQRLLRRQMAKEEHAVDLLC